MREQVRVTSIEQFNGDLQYHVSNVAVDAYNTAQETPVENSSIDTDQLIDDAVIEQSHKLEQLIKDKEQLMVSYFLGLKSGNLEEVERIKKLIKDVSLEAYNEFIIEIDAKIIAILKTLDIEKLVAKRKEDDIRFTKEEIDNNINENQEESIPKKVEPITNVEEVKSQGNFNPANPEYLANIFAAVGCPIDKKEDVVEDVTIVKEEESIVSGWGNVPPKEVAKPMATIKEEMARLNIVVPEKKKEQPCDTEIGTNGLTIFKNPQGDVIAIGDIILDARESMIVNRIKNKTPEQIYKMRKDNERSIKERAEVESVMIDTSDEPYLL